MMPRMLITFLVAVTMSACAGMRAQQNASKGLFQGGGGDIAAARAPAARTPHAERGTYIWPVKDGAISSWYGKRRRDFHEGIDISAPKGTPIFAAKDGLVIYSAKQIKGYGNMIVIKHGDGSATVYAHNQKNFAIRGRYVKQGERIALVGRTGKATGPHVHFEIREGQLPIDP